MTARIMDMDTVKALKAFRAKYKRDPIDVPEPWNTDEEYAEAKLYANLNRTKTDDDIIAEMRKIFPGATPMRLPKVIGDGGETLESPYTEREFAIKSALILKHINENPQDFLSKAEVDKLLSGGAQ